MKKPPARSWRFQKCLLFDSVWLYICKLFVLTGQAVIKGDLLSRERRSPFEPLRERQGRFDFAPAPLTTKREGPCPSFLDYPPRCCFWRRGIASLAALWCCFFSFLLWYRFPLLFAGRRWEYLWHHPNSVFPAFPVRLWLHWQQRIHFIVICHVVHHLSFNVLLL